jgi:hypothetical protein
LLRAGCKRDPTLHEGRDAVCSGPSPRTELGAPYPTLPASARPTALARRGRSKARTEVLTRGAAPHEYLGAAA